MDPILIGVCIGIGVILLIVLLIGCCYYYSVRKARLVHKRREEIRHVPAPPPSTIPVSNPGLNSGNGSLRLAEPSRIPSQLVVPSYIQEYQHWYNPPEDLDFEICDPIPPESTIPIIPRNASLHKPSMIPSQVIVPSYIEENQQWYNPPEDFDYENEICEPVFTIVNERDTYSSRVRLNSTPIQSHKEVNLPSKLSKSVPNGRAVGSSGISHSLSIDESSSQEKYKLEVKEKLKRFRGLQAQMQMEPRPPNAAPFLVCVDARPTQIAGYCINFKTKLCSYYTYKTEVLPWELHNTSREGDADEFEMKNLMFALILWEDEIKTATHVQIHTDNNAITRRRQNNYGSRASEFIKHLARCEGVRVNSDIYVNSKSSPTQFAKYIQPADDLSRWRIDECVAFLKRIYPISNFRKTHALQHRGGLGVKPYHPPTSNYNKFINIVKERIQYWKKKPCYHCGFMVEDTVSLRSLE